jgi:hypothetical protein
MILHSALGKHTILVLAFTCSQYASGNGQAFAVPFWGCLDQLSRSWTKWSRCCGQRLHVCKCLGC